MEHFSSKSEGNKSINWATLLEGAVLGPKVSALAITPIVKRNFHFSGFDYSKKWSETSTYQTQVAWRIIIHILVSKRLISSVEVHPKLISFRNGVI